MSEDRKKEVAKVKGRQQAEEKAVENKRPSLLKQDEKSVEDANETPRKR